MSGDGQVGPGAPELGIGVGAAHGDTGVGAAPRQLDAVRVCGRGVDDRTPARRHGRFAPRQVRRDGEHTPVVEPVIGRVIGQVTVLAAS